MAQLTDEVEKNYDRRGNRLEPLKSAVDLHRERFARHLEQVLYHSTLHGRNSQ